MVCLLCGLFSQLHAHPHVLVDVSVTPVFNEAGFAGVKNHWVYEEDFSAMTLAAVDTDKNGLLSAEEQGELQEKLKPLLEKNNYYNYIQISVDFLKAKKMDGFKARMENGRLVVDFFVHFFVPVSKEYAMLTLVVADPANDILITTQMEEARVESPQGIEVEYFADVLEGLTLFRAFRSEVQGLFLRFRKL